MERTDSSAPPAQRAVVTLRAPIECTIAAPTSSTRGKLSSISLKNGEPYRLNFSKFCRSPFGASAWDKNETVRLTLDLTLDDVQVAFFNKLDAQIISQLAAKSTTYFKKNMTKEEITAIFKPSATYHEKDGLVFPHTVRTKITVCGPRAVKCWNEEKIERPIPLDWRSCEVRPQVVVRSIWFMSNQLGLTFETANALLREEVPECPF